MKLIMLGLVIVSAGCSVMEKEASVDSDAMGVSYDMTLIMPDASFDEAPELGMMEGGYNSGHPMKVFHVKSLLRTPIAGNLRALQMSKRVRATGR